MKKPLAILALVTAVASCKSDKVSGPPGPLEGTFVLRSIAGAPLPAAGNIASAAPFTIIADTLVVGSGGFAVETIVTSSSVMPAKQVRSLNVWDKGSNAFDAEYPCPDNMLSSLTASCIAPPHHKGMLTSNGLTLDYSVVYRTPLVFERVSAPVTQ